MTERRLSVFSLNERVGTVVEGSGAVVFEYEDNWVSKAGAFPLSLSMPLSLRRHEGAAVRNWFANLLPEGALRQTVTARLGISEDNDFALLSRIGGDCAGALSVFEEENRLEEFLPPSYRELTRGELMSLNRSGTFVPLLLEDRHVRLSLAGAQDKLPVRLDGKRILLPENGAASTHILKMPGNRFKHLPANESFLSRLAAAVGLPVVNVSLLRPFGKIELSICERYDRRVRFDGFVERVHQEDLCQALGFSAARKYEVEGGPSFARCHQLIVSRSASPLEDSRTLLRALIFSATTGNCDAHAKNYSLVFHSPGGPSLAPLYDLVTTRAYPQLSRHLAMRIGNESDPGKLKVAHLRAQAETIEVGGRYFSDLARETAEAVLASLKPTIAQFKDEYGEHPVLQLVPPVIRKQSTMLLRNLTMGI